MNKPHNTLITVTRVVIAVILIGFLVFRAVESTIAHRSMENTSKNINYNWHEESFGFASGSRCHVFQELKLAVFFGDGGIDEVFDRINDYGQSKSHTANSFTTSFSWTNDGSAVSSSYQSHDGMATMRSSHGNGKCDNQCVMVVSEHGTKLTLADGRDFTLDRKMPLWLRCKSDGTIVQLDELPDGFIEFFDSPPPDPGFIDRVKSYPEAFQK